MLASPRYVEIAPKGGGVDAAPSASMVGSRRSQSVRKGARAGGTFHPRRPHRERFRGESSAWIQMEARITESDDFRTLAIAGP
jgi:hypothetical protein